MFFRKLFKKTKHTTYETCNIDPLVDGSWADLEPDERAISTAHNDYQYGYLQVRLSKGNKSLVFHILMMDLPLMHLVFASMLGVLRNGTDEDIRYVQEQDNILFAKATGKQ